MKTKKATTKSRNWGVVLIASIQILLGFTLVALAFMNIASFGWWSLAIGLGGLFTVTMSILSIVKNDPSWLLLDLIIPG